MKVVEKMLDWENGGKMDLLKVNYPLRAPEILFRKVEDAEVLAQVEKLKKESKKMETAKASEEKPKEATAAIAKPTIQFDDFAKVDLRVGTILTAEKVEKADKLLKLTIDTGIDQRTVVSGIAEYFEPEAIIGQKVSILVNLEPREIKGILSQGMILMAENQEGKLTFVAPVEGFANGSVIR